MTIKELRVSRNLTQAKFAELIGVDRSDLGKMENGKKNISDRIHDRIWEVFGVEVGVEEGKKLVKKVSVPKLEIYIHSLKNKTARDFFEGKSTVLIKDGKILEDNLKKEKYTSDELLELLRGKSAFSVAEVEFAVLEPSGELNVLLKKDSQPLTAKDIGLKVPNEKEPQTVIMDGNVLDEPLSASGHNRAWLHSELEKIGVVIENVFLGQVDSYGQLTIDIYNDKLQMPSPQNKPLLLASLKKCHADLELFSLETKSKSASEMYSKNAKQIEKILNKVTYLLKD